MCGHVARRLREAGEELSVLLAHGKSRQDELEDMVRGALERADAEAWIWLGRRLGLPSEDRGAGDDAPEIPWCLRWDA